MTDLLAARLQMGISLGFHIVFACIGMTMPWLMALAEWRWLLGFYAAQAPALVRMASGDLTLENSKAPDSTLQGLSWAIAVGLALIVPGVVYLVGVYKIGGARRPASH